MKEQNTFLEFHSLKARNSKRQSSLITSASIPPRYKLVCAAGVKDSITAIALRRSRIVYKFPCANCNAAYKLIIISPHTPPRFPKRLQTSDECRNSSSAEPFPFWILLTQRPDLLFLVFNSIYRICVMYHLYCKTCIHSSYS